MQRTSHAKIITRAMKVFFMHKRLNLMTILDNWLMPPFILMTLGTLLCLGVFLHSGSTQEIGGPVRFYSLRSASIGSILAARTDGKKPKISPIPIDTITAIAEKVTSIPTARPYTL